MKHCVLLSLLLALGCAHVQGAPVAPDGMEQGSCEDATAMAAAGLALTKINQDRQEGYVFALHRLSNMHMAKHGETGVVFYLTLDVVETNCSVLSKKDWEDCEAQPTHNTPVYGQCKAVIYLNKVHRVVRLYKYDCVITPVPSTRVHELCPDCPSFVSFDNAEVQKSVSLSLEKFNSESGLSNRFALLKISRATAGMAMSMYYNAEYTIQETTCTKSAGAADKCPLMECEFAHKGFCKASLFYSPTGDADSSVECEIYEPEAAEREKKHHLLGGETDHNHTDTHAHSHTHDGVHAADAAHTHDHVHDHTKGHTHHDQSQKHADNSDHHHTHDHGAGSTHRHAHDHSHDHGHGHDHVHTHHAKAHNHSGDSPNQHHTYMHAGSDHTHEHDHELALDHDHKHAHLHDHEHHHHHHDHVHETTTHDHPEGIVRFMPAVDQPTTLPFFPVLPGPVVGVTLPLKPDPQIPGQIEPTILAFPMAVSANCAPAAAGVTLVEKLFSEDPRFKTAA
ncbi:histidine-rich glycoprotein-like [Anoplopoma fimbria]|uniref:histidine-rich glycoprotein-like n=1 Tax=Anoplopoma fimbria TaxID=229290 RepID=UPI0023ED052A|nr:histidine-rich glycoprotein-like [Anoplopoma fimbria]